MFCPCCGSRLPDGARFCASCGTRLGEKSVAPAPTPASTPRPRRRRAPVAAAAIALVALLAGGVAAWWFLLRPKPVYVCAASHYVTETSIYADSNSPANAVIIVPASAYINYLAPELNLRIVDSYEYERSERGALTKMTCVADQPDGTERIEYAYELDKFGNTAAHPDSGQSLSIEYDDQQRPVTVSDSYYGTRTTYVYGQDGSYSCERVGSDGQVVYRALTDSEGKMTSMTQVDSYDGSRVEVQYDEGFATSLRWTDADGSLVRVIRGTPVRDGAGRVTQIVLSVSSGDGEIMGLGYYDRICFEYDENGNISRCYAPWKSADAWQVFSDGDAPGVPSTENVYDYRLEYERVDNPTPLVRALGGRSLLP